MVEPSTVTDILRASGVVFTPYEEDRFWSIPFSVDEREKITFLFSPQGSKYFIAIAPIVSPKLEGRLSDLPKETLCTIIRASSEAILSKVQCVEEAPGAAFFAISECSVEDFSASKLYHRLEACASLAMSLENALR